MKAPLASRLSLNQATVKRLGLGQVLELAQRHGIPSVGLWRESLAEAGMSDATRAVARSGLRVSGLCRAGFFTSSDAGERSRALEDARRAIGETAEIVGSGAAGSCPTLALVVGGIDRDGLAAAREQVRASIEDLVPDAVAAGVRLGVEPLHPMYAADRAVINTLDQALDLVHDLPPRAAGVVIDAFHVWWDPRLSDAIARAGQEGRIASVQISDWRTPLPSDVLLSRRLPGDGVIDLRGFLGLVDDAGWGGDVEVEVFHQGVWDSHPDEIAQRLSAFALDKENASPS